MEPLASFPNLPHFRTNKPRLRGRGPHFTYTDGAHFFEQVTIKNVHVYTRRQALYPTHLGSIGEWSKPTRLFTLEYNWVYRFYLSAALNALCSTLAAALNVALSSTESRR